MTVAEKILTLDQALILRAQLRSQGKTLVFTNGCFDLLHAGHVHYLKEARSQGDFLLVGINSDLSVRQLKGSDRPLRNETKRLEMLGRLECVDATLVFPEAHVTDLLLKLKPDVYVKGGDYTMESIDPVLRASLKKENIPVFFLGHVPGISTTLLLEKLSPAELKKLEDSGGIAE
jgi:D-glycero-beta-D-manno-heptose 1-phosphate adenylyltransferase